MKQIILTNNTVVPVIPTRDFRTSYTPRIQPRRALNSVWRFKPDDRVFVRGWSAYGIILDRVAGLAWPHYRIMDAEGDVFQVSQLHLSTKPLEPAA